ncbi:MAG: MOSC domain-containing protein [Proteobacteria bacterium]|nr:MOSC domain-containing protein [Pseudomonadota bacterium]
MNIIKAISISDRKGTRKTNIDTTRLIANFGLENDAHGGKWHRQVSFLAQESINTMRAKGLDVVAGNFAENITTEGLDLTSLEVGRHISIGDAELVISQLGKICHTRCAIFHQAGDCVMPREGIFAVIQKGGTIRIGDAVKVEENISRSAAIIGSKETEEHQGDELQRLVREKFHPAFIRFDAITTREGGTLAAILDDLTATQKTSDIVVFDPSGSLGLALTGYSPKGNRPNCYQRETSSIFYCRSIAEVEGLPLKL